LFKVIGIGNPLMGDDGVGIAAVERLQQMELPANVEVIDGGTGGLTLLSLMEGAKQVILIDAVDMGRAPGTIGRFSLEDLLPATPATTLSFHAAGILPALQLGLELDLLPPLFLYGIQPATLTPGQMLSPAVTAALDSLLPALQTDLSV